MYGTPNEVGEIGAGKITLSTKQCNLNGVSFYTDLIVLLSRYLNGNKIVVSEFLSTIISFQVGVQIFTKRPVEEQEKNINPDDIISCLNKYPKARVKYLEHLVLERKIEVSPTKISKIVYTLNPMHVVTLKIAKVQKKYT